MSVDRSSERDSAVLGVVVHGPAVVAESVGIAVAVRCIFARPGGLEIDLVLQAAGVQAEAAARQTFGQYVPGFRTDAETEDSRPGGSELTLFVGIDGRRAIAYPQWRTDGGGEDQFSSELRVTIAELPSDGLVTVTASWPQAGLAEASVTLSLDSLDDLETRVIQLPT